MEAGRTAAGGRGGAVTAPDALLISEVILAVWKQHLTLTISVAKEVNEGTLWRHLDAEETAPEASRQGPKTR